MMIAFLILTSAVSAVYTNGQERPLAMSNLNISKDIPPFYSSDEELADDEDFLIECESEASALAKEMDVRIEPGKLTYNRNYGLVWRARYYSVDGNPEFVNLIMFWRQADGTFAKLVGANI